MTCPACGKDVLDIDVKCGHCGAGLGSTGAQRLLGTVMLGQYELVDVLGQGGMSVVFKGRHKMTDQEVALKILPPELVKDEDRVRRFGLEAKSASSLSHPNIVTIYEIGKGAVRSPGAPDSGPVHYISMELVSGKTLGTLIHEDKVDLRTLLSS